MLKKRSWIYIVYLILILTVAGCSNTPAEEDENSNQATNTNAETNETTVGTNDETGSEEVPVADEETVMMATTTSTADTGLLDYLAPIFLEDTGLTLEWASVGTGEALTMGENGDVDVVLVHAKASEEEFVESDAGVERVPVMYNDFVVVGPAEPISPSDDIAAVFTQITEEQLPFVNRGDDSGTDKKEKQIWESISIDPTTNPNYIESGQGMGATLTMADEQNAYCLSDRGTYLKSKNDSTVGLESVVICEGDENLLNQYGIIAVNPEKYEDTNIDGANAFIEWITSEKVQNLIGEYGVEEYGVALFVPNAGADA